MDWESHSIPLRTPWVRFKQLPSWAYQGWRDAWLHQTQRGHVRNHQGRKANLFCSTPSMHHTCLEPATLLVKMWCGCAVLGSQWAISHSTSVLPSCASTVSNIWRPILLKPVGFHFFLLILFVSARILSIHQNVLSSHYWHT